MQKSFSFFGLAVVFSISGPLICTGGAVLVRSWGIEGVSGPDPVPNVFGLLMYSANITTFHLLQAVMSGVVLWFQHCNPPCYSSFSAAVTCHCKLRYLPVSQNGCAKWGVLPRHLLIKCYLGSDSWFNHSARKQEGANHPSFACKRLPCGNSV